MCVLFCFVLLYALYMHMSISSKLLLIITLKYRLTQRASASYDVSSCPRTWCVFPFVQVICFVLQEQFKFLNLVLTVP